MSTNTQVQGRTFYTERNFPFTPRVDDDTLRSLYRWEAQLLDQLNVGNVTLDPAAKLRALTYGGGTIALATPATVTNLALTQNAVADVTLSTISVGVPASVSSTSGVVPTGTALSIVGQTVKLTGTPTGLGGFTFTATVVTDNGSVDIPVSGTVAAP